MGKFDPEKLFVEYLNGTKDTQLTLPRRYTLTHSDASGELFLRIGKQYAWEMVNPLRDEVLGEWIIDSFSVFVLIDDGHLGDFGEPSIAARRYEIFKRELPLALTAIRYGDAPLFHAFPALDRAPIHIHFLSSYPAFSKQEYWGVFRDFTTQ